MTSQGRQRPSTSSRLNTNVASSSSLDLVAPLKSPSLRMSVKPPSKSTHAVSSFPVQTKPIEEDLSKLGPDQMFARFSVSEVRALQGRLRSEADSKQEELRVMVGERYRDLLQASSSIESISDSSQRVRTALENMKAGCSTSKDIRALKTQGHRKRQSLFGGALYRGSASAEDSQLITLQSLAAHLKLLLDTPEQLWRLLERKRYLQAAWLYLLARVVYRALSVDDEDEDEHDMDWGKEGIQIAQQFPLVQRQWDTIGTFRSQIAYRASQSLRDYPPQQPSSTATPTPHQSSAETLLSILLLDSLPLSETLSLFLSQRTKTLQAVYSGIENTPQTPAIHSSRRKNQEMAASLLRSPNPPSTPVIADGELKFRFPVDGTGNSSANIEQLMAVTKKDKAVRRVRQSLRRVVVLLGATVGAVRDIFDGNESRPLIQELLDNITTGAVAEPSGPARPASTALSTQFLLSTLPSSTLLVRYLPASIQSYAPYIDTESTSSRLPPAAVASAVFTWFDISLKSLEGRLSAWLQDLDNIRNIWGIWTGLQFGHTSDGGRSSLDVLTDKERTRLQGLVKEVCMRRVREVWRDKLADIEVTTVREAQRCIEVLRKDEKESYSDVEPSSFYFSPTYLTLGSGNEIPVGPLSASTAMKKCKDALKQRVSNRTPLVNSILNQLESLSRDLNEELAALQGPDGSTSDVAAELLAEYVPGAQAAVLEMAKSLADLLRKEANYDPPSRVDTGIAVFIGRVALELGFRSSFIVDLLPASSDLQAFRSKMSKVHDASLDRWRAYAVAAAADEWRRIFGNTETSSSPPSIPSGPSPHLMQSLMKLTSSVQSLGFTQSASQNKHVERHLLDAFASRLTVETPSSLGSAGPQVLWDLTFVSRLCAETGSNNKDLPTLLERVKTSVHSSTSLKDGKDLSSRIAATIESQLNRTQLLIGPLLPSTRSGPSGPTSTQSPTGKPNLNHGRSGTVVGQANPIVPGEKDLQLAVDVAKPTSRFGMLLVGSADIRS